MLYAPSALLWFGKVRDGTDECLAKVPKMLRLMPGRTVAA
jgi:hypothetical protein